MTDRTDPNTAAPAIQPAPEPSPRPVMRRLMRSRVLHVTSLMATASFSLAACGVPQAAPPPEEPSLAYTSLAECKAANDITDAECDAGLNNARVEAGNNSPRYASQQECEGQWGPSQCQPMNHSGGGSFFTPLLTGFVVGQMLNGGGYRGGGPLYRDRDGRFQNGYGGYLGRDARTGRAMANGRDYGDIARQAPSRVQSRTTVVSRGGFGGGGRSFGG